MLLLDVAALFVHCIQLNPMPVLYSNFDSDYILIMSVTLTNSKFDSDYTLVMLVTVIDSARILPLSPFLVIILIQNLIMILIQF